MAGECVWRQIALQKGIPTKERSKRSGVDASARRSRSWGRPTRAGEAVCKETAAVEAGAPAPPQTWGRQASPAHLPHLSSQSRTPTPTL